MTAYLELSSNKDDLNLFVRNLLQHTVEELVHLAVLVVEWGS